MSAATIDLSTDDMNDFDIHGYLDEERAKDLLRFSTAGSVDDGKSTLIGRLLYDTRSVYDDQIRSIEGKGTTAPGVLDLALLTDGLRAEREQGITIDVAYRYFSTPRRKFIIADTPGHEQYTRNMATGASTADAAIVLIDARKGVLPQSRRHAYITALLNVSHLILAVNKMDLVGYEKPVFDAILREFLGFADSLRAEGLRIPQLHFLPVSALEGDNIVHRSEAMPWYRGPSLLELLESVSTTDSAQNAPFRFTVQRVVRPNLDFRGFAGQIASGTIRPGDRIVALPSGKTSTVERIVTFDGDLAQAHAPQSVTLTLTGEIDISRGDLIATADEPASQSSFLNASLVWMNEAPLERGRRYSLRHGSRSVHATVRALTSKADLSLETIGVPAQDSDTLALNEIGEVVLDLKQALAFDPYVEQRHTGSFVLIDLATNATVAAGMIRSAADATVTSTPRTADEGSKLFGHRGAHLTLHAEEEFADQVEWLLFEEGANVLRTPAMAFEAIHALTEQQMLVLTVVDSEGPVTLRVDGNEAVPGVVAKPADVIEALYDVGIFQQRGAAA